jgi:hypothetical protein
MTDDSIELDGYRGMVARKATDLRRLRLEVQTDEAALRVRQEALEQMLVALPAEGWPEAVEKARYLLGLFAETQEAQEPRRRRLIAELLVDFERLLGAPPDPSDTRDVYASTPPHSASDAHGSAGR